jgi:hypothetical protein
MYPDPGVVPRLAGLYLCANLVVLTMSSLCLLCAFLKLLTVFDIFITPGTMFQAFPKIFKFKGSATLLVVLMESYALLDQVMIVFVGSLRASNIFAGINK